jgi:hypothetical protein
MARWLSTGRSSYRLASAIRVECIDAGGTAGIGTSVIMSPSRRAQSTCGTEPFDDGTGWPGATFALEP